MIHKLRYLSPYSLKLLRGKATNNPLGHSPTGVASVLILLGLILATASSGWILTLEDYVGEEWVEDLHHLFFNITLTWVSLHIFVVIILSLLYRQNKIMNMITGGVTDSESTSETIGIIKDNVDSSNGNIASSHKTRN